MAFDPEELVTLTDHGIMKLRSAVARAMILRPKERKRAHNRPTRQTSDLKVRTDQEPGGNSGMNASCPSSSRPQSGNCTSGREISRPVMRSMLMSESIKSATARWRRGNARLRAAIQRRDPAHAGERNRHGRGLIFRAWYCGSVRPRVHPGLRKRPDRRRWRGHRLVRCGPTLCGILANPFPQRPD
jgi:hypothetical protein